MYMLPNNEIKNNDNFRKIKSYDIIYNYNG